MAGSYSWGLRGAPGRPFGKSSRKRRATASGTSSSTFPPNDAISFTPLEEMKLYCGLDITYIVSISGASRLVEAVHLELPLEVGDHAQAFHHRLRVVLAREVDDELVEDVHRDVVETGKRLLEEGDSFVDREQRLLVMRVADDADDDTVERGAGTADHVDVAERDRVVRAWADSGDHRVKSVIRAEP